MQSFFIWLVRGDVFQAVEHVPSKDAGDFYIRYAKLEETHGLMRHAASVMDRACAAVEDSERLDMFRLYVAKVLYKNQSHRRNRDKNAGENDYVGGDYDHFDDGNGEIGGG